MKYKRQMSFLLVLLLLTALLAGCGGGTTAAEAQTESTPASTTQEQEERAVAEEQASASDVETETQTPSAEDGAEPTEPEALAYSLPIEDKEISISYWISWNPDLSSVCAAEDASVYRALEEATGVQVEYVESSPFNMGQDFDLMIVSGDYVDVFPASGNLSAEQANEQEISIDLTPYIDTYLKDYYAILGTNTEYMRAAQSSEGDI